jgi:hypothetical protein
VSIPFATRATTQATQAGYYAPDSSGALHDVKTNATIKITSGSNSVIATNSPFSSSDTGKLAWVQGAGANAQHLIGYLQYVDVNHCNILVTPGGSAQNASTTLLGTGGTMVYGTDDSAAIQAAFVAAQANSSNPGTLLFGPYSYMTSGTLGDAGTLHIKGVGVGQTKIYCTADYFWKNDATNLTRADVSDFSLFPVNHGFCDSRSQAQSSGLPLRLWYRLAITNYTGCAWQNNTADGPGYKIDHCTFTGWDEIATIAVVLSGQSDSSGVTDCQSAGAHRCIYRVTRGPNCEIKDGGLTTGIPAGICNLADGAMTTGTDILTSATATFDSSHLGCTVTVAKASSAGGQNNVGTLTSVIRQVDSPTQVRLNDQASLTASSAAVGIKAKARPCRVANDAATSTGSKTITSATAAFVSGDIGSGVTIVGAGWDTHTGSPSGDFNARIQSVTNSTTAVVNVAATAAVSGAKMTIQAPQVKIHLEGFSNSTNAANGFSINNMKFGSEKILPGDIEFGIMDSDIDLVVADGAMTSGSATLTSATSAFTSDMAKARFVYVVGAGTNGSDIYSRVESYVSATQVTLNAAAGATVTGASVTRTKLNGSRMPVHNQVSTNIVVQASIVDCNFGNSGNGSGGVSLSPYYSTTPNVRASIWGPNIEYGSGFLWQMEYGPGVTATNDQFNTTNLVYPLIDDNAGRTRLAAAISNLPGMFAKQVTDPPQVGGIRLPSFAATPGGSYTSVTHLLKTRSGALSVNANATLVGAVGDSDSSDAAEYSFTTYQGVVSATILQADIIVGDPVHIGFGIASGSSSTVDRVKVIVKYGSGSTLFQEYVDVPASGTGYRWVDLKMVFPTATGNVQLQFATDIAGRFKIARPVMYHSRGPVNFGPRKWISPDGTEYTESIDNSGNLSGVSISGTTSIPQKWKAGGYYYTYPGANSTVTMALGSCSWHPIFVPAGAPNSIDHLACELVTLGTNTTDPCVRMGIYADGGSFEPSGTPLLDAGLSTALTTTGKVEVAASYTWPAKATLYWFCWCLQRLDQASTAIGGTNPTFRIGLGSIGAHTTLINGGTGLGSGYHQASVYTGFTAPTLDYSTVLGTPKVWAKTV